MSKLHNKVGDTRDRDVDSSFLISLLIIGYLPAVFFFGIFGFLEVGFVFAGLILFFLVIRELYHKLIAKDRFFLKFFLGSISIISVLGFLVLLPWHKALLREYFSFMLILFSPSAAFSFAMVGLDSSKKAKAWVNAFISIGILFGSFFWVLLTISLSNYD
jgi:hypothetical protein